MKKAFSLLFLFFVALQTGCAPYIGAAMEHKKESPLTEKTKASDQLLHDCQNVSQLDPETTHTLYTLLLISKNSNCEYAAFELSQLSSFDLKSKNISKLGAILYFQNILYLDLSHNPLSAEEFSKVTALKNLQTIILSPADEQRLQAPIQELKTRNSQIIIQIKSLPF